MVTDKGSFGNYILDWPGSQLTSRAGSKRGRLAGRLIFV